MTTWPTHFGAWPTLSRVMGNTMSGMVKVHLRSDDSTPQTLCGITPPMTEAETRPGGARWIADRWPFGPDDCQRCRRIAERRLA
jgi:hypothetical protein